MKPWYHETTEPALFNEWTWSHFAWGMAAAKFGPEHGIGFLGAVVLHTIYESVEGFIFPDPNRDVSMRNHAGDTIAFAAGWAVN